MIKKYLEAIMLQGIWGKKIERSKAEVFERICEEGMKQ